MATTYIPVISTEENYKLAFPATENPQPNGKATPGASECWAREDHVHPDACRLIITDENMHDYVKQHIDEETGEDREGYWLEVPPQTELVYFDTTQHYGNLRGIRPTPETEFNNFHRMTVIGAFFRESQKNHYDETETEDAGVRYGMSTLFYGYYKSYSGNDYPRWAFIDLIFVEKTKIWYSKC